MIIKMLTGNRINRSQILTLGVTVPLAVQVASAEDKTASPLQLSEIRVRDRRSVSVSNQGRQAAHDLVQLSLRKH